MKRTTLFATFATLVACGSITGAPTKNLGTTGTPGASGTTGNTGSANPGSANCGPTGNGNTAGNANLPTAAEEAAWYTTNSNTPYAVRLAGVSLEASATGTYATSFAGQMVRAAIVRDSDPNQVQLHKGLLNKDSGLTIPFQPVLPLPNDPNAPSDTYTLYACIDSKDTGACDGPSFVQPIGQDYQNTLNSNVVHWAFDENGTLALPVKSISGFIAHVSLDHAAIASSGQLQDIAKFVHTEPPAGVFTLTYTTLPNGPSLGNPGSGAQFIIQAVTVITDKAPNGAVYSIFKDPSLGGNESLLSTQVLQAGHSYTVQTNSFRGALSCSVNGQTSCEPECTYTLNDVENDVFLMESVGNCTNVY